MFVWVNTEVRKRALDPLEEKLQVSVSHSVDAENQANVLRKNKCS